MITLGPNPIFSALLRIKFDGKLFKLQYLIYITIDLLSSDRERSQRAQLEIQGDSKLELYDSNSAKYMQIAVIFIVSADTC